MRNIKRRLTELEKAVKPNSERWHWIVADDQTYEQALAEYERSHGPVAEGDNVICWEVIDPPARGAA